MSASLALEKPLVIAYLGPEATYSHMAVIKKFGSSLKYEPLPSITGRVHRSGRRAAPDYGVVPIENSTEGAVTHTYDMFVDSELKICAQIVLQIRHNLMAACPRDQIKKLYSIPQVLAQCRQWLQNQYAARRDHRNVEQHAGGANRQDRAERRRAGQFAGRRNVRAERSTTRIFRTPARTSRGFWSRPEIPAAHRGNDKTSLMYAAKTGSAHCMTASRRSRSSKINMTKIESRPSRKKAWEYYFFRGHRWPLRRRACQEKRSPSSPSIQCSSRSSAVTLM